MNIKKIIIIVVVIIIVVSGGWILMQKYSQEIPTQNQATTTPEMLTYRNTEFGFEFQYPKGWTFEETLFYSPASKFNLIGASPEEKGIGNPVFPSFLINIVTPEFAESADINRRNLGAIESAVIIDGVKGIKYEYTEKVLKISIDLPFKQYHILFGVKKQYEPVFNQILASFKFLK